VRELLSRTTSADIAFWVAYYKMDPWDETREDLRTGIVSSVIANVNKGKSGRPFTPADFMPKFDKVEETKSKSKTSDEGEMVEMMRAFSDASKKA